MKRKTVLLIDGDIIAYKHASGSEVPIDWGDDIWSLYTDVRSAKQALDADIKRLIMALEGDEAVVALSGKNIFRQKVDPNYKASRRKTRKPIGLAALREHLTNEWNACCIDELEADDLLGIWATDILWFAGSRKIIVSTDKDMNTIPAKLWNPLHPEHGVKDISVEEADRYHLFQTLVGDSTDGYSGCPTVGPATAGKILNDDPSWEAVVKTYKKKGLSEEQALTQGRLARILRVENYNMRKRTLKHWIP